MKKVRRGAVENMCTGGWARLKQMFTIFLCIVLIGQMQNAMAVGQEPAQESQQVKPTTPPATPPNPAQKVDPVGQDQLPAAPAPQISMVIQQAQPQSGQETTPQQPLGTAAAPYEKPVGVPGSRPAGAAIAPAKQRRVRAIAIKVGLLLAGAGAVGAVVGLSRASHSEP